MRHIKKTFFALVLGLIINNVSFAADKANAKEAKLMVENALVHIKKVGVAQAFKDFSNPSDKEWHDRDLYLFAYSLNGENLAHGTNSRLINRNLIDLKTPDGIYLIKEMINIAINKGDGWIDYDWPHPDSRKIERKSGYVKRIAGFNGFVGSGIYK